MTATDWEIKKSKINGKGVFAKRDFKKGELVLVYRNPRLITKPQVDRLPPKQLEYISKYGKKYILHQVPERYVNHSCKANTRATKKGDVATRPIRKGEEITADYLKEKGCVFHFWCQCGSKKCRGFLDKN